MSFEVDITVRRGDREIAVRFAAEAGITALFGPSGAGKTTVLDCVAGLVRPNRGRIALAGAALFDSTKRICLPPDARACGYVFQDNRLFPHRSVRQNLLFGHNRTPPERRWMSIDEAADFLGIRPLFYRMPRTLSGGESQRVAIGRALLSGPRLLLLDEPLSSLDAARRDDIMRVIERVRDELKLPMLYVSHDADEVERLAARIVKL